MDHPQYLNSPPMSPSMLGMPSMPDNLGSDLASMRSAEAAFANATKTKVPTIDSSPDCLVTLCAGWISQNGSLVTTAMVKELTGFDEERLSRFNAAKSPGVFVSEVLLAGVEDLGGTKPTRTMLQDLLIGDRDMLLLGVRRATFGDEVQFSLNCEDCKESSEVIIELSKDVEVVNLDDPLKRVFDVELRHGSAVVQLMNGHVQEAVGDLPSSSTGPELNTLLLRRCVLEINGMPIAGNDDVRNLSAGDRATLIDFITSHSPGPKLGEVKIPCATCGREYPAPLTIGNLFRFR